MKFEQSGPEMVVFEVRGLMFFVLGLVVRAIRDDRDLEIITCIRSTSQSFERARENEERSNRSSSQES